MAEIVLMYFVIASYLLYPYLLYQGSTIKWAKLSKSNQEHQTAINFSFQELCMKLSHDHFVLA